MFKKDKRTNNIKKANIYIIVFIIIILLINIFSEDITSIYNKYYLKSVINSIELTKDIESLINNIELEEDEDIIYKRDEWGSTARIFNCPITGDNVSIKSYSINMSTYTINNSYDDNFQFLDPYTGNIIIDYDEIEYDHIIPLHYVAKHNGNDWTDELKDKYAFDLNVGIPCSKKENRIKSDKGPSEYLPPKNKEEYCYTWLVIANEYNISLTKEDMETIMLILDGVDNIDIINKYN